MRPPVLGGLALAQHLGGLDAAILDAVVGGVARELNGGPVAELGEALHGAAGGARGIQDPGIVLLVEPEQIKNIVYKRRL